jgi:hypothetical protein
MRRIFDSLKHEGLLLITFGLSDSKAKTATDWYGHPMIWSHYDQNKSREMLIEAGFRIIFEDIVGPDNDKFVYFKAIKKS